MAAKRTSTVSKRLLTTSEVRDLIEELTGVGVDPVTVRNWCHRGVGGRRLRHIRVGAKIRIPAEAVQEFLDRIQT